MTIKFNIHGMSQYSVVANFAFIYNHDGKVNQETCSSSFAADIQKTHEQGSEHVICVLALKSGD